MSQDDKFWIECWKILGAIVIALGLFVSSCTIYESHLVVEGVKQGADPVRMRCGMSMSSSIAGCSIMAAKEIANERERRHD
jgi:hypothetical protein